MIFSISRMPPDELRHWGIKGQKWGVRRFENKDGTLTEEGKERYQKKVHDYGIKEQKIRKKVDELCQKAAKYDSFMNLPYARAVRNEMSANKLSVKKEELQKKLYGDDFDKISSDEKENPNYRHTKYSTLPIKERLKAIDSANLDDDDASNDCNNVTWKIGNIIDESGSIARLPDIYKTKEYKDWESEYQKEYERVSKKYGDQIKRQREQVDALDYGAGTHAQWKKAFDKYNALRDKMNKELLPTAKKQYDVIDKYRKEAINTVCNELGIPSDERDAETLRIINWYFKYI